MKKNQKSKLLSLIKILLFSSFQSAVPKCLNIFLYQLFASEQYFFLPNLFWAEGKSWWMLMLVLRLLVLLLAGFSLFGDEQDRFVCNTIQPGCSNICFDAFAPVSILRLWFFHLLLLFLPHLLFSTYVAHRLLSRPGPGLSYYDRIRSPFVQENSSSSREVSLHKAPLQDLQHPLWEPGFHCAYLQVVVVRILLEVVFGGGQFFLFGWSIPRSFLCYEAPCTSGVECYISRSTEKTLMLCFMLAVAASSILLSLLDLASTMKAMVVWRRRRELLVKEMSKGEQCSVFTSTTLAEDLRSKDEKHATALPPAHARTNAGCNIRDEEVPERDRRPESRGPKLEVSPTPAPTHFVLHSYLRPPMSPRPGRAPPTKLGHPVPAVEGSSDQQSDSSDSQDKKAWV